MLFSLIVMQPIDLCNLNCSYCYLPGRKDKALMSDTVLDASLNSIFNSSMAETMDQSDTITFLWHSGEPLTAGIKFYEKAVNKIKHYNKNGINIDFEIQSNATLITKEWCEFIKKNNISISVSIDGPDFIHDKYRKNWGGKGSHKLAMRGVECLKNNNISARSICVLTKDSLDHPEEMYNFFKNNGFEAVGFNIDEQECLNENSSFSMTDNNIIIKDALINQYKQFMSKVYDLWEKDKRSLRIREFDRILQQIKFRKEQGFDQFVPNQEVIAFSIVSITKDGNISLFSPELAGGTLDDRTKFVVGNVLKIRTLDDLIANPIFLSQFDAIKTGVKNCSEQCAYFDFCGGGSPCNKFYEIGSFEATETTNCLFKQKILIDLVANKLKKYKSPGMPTTN